MLATFYMWFVVEVAEIATPPWQQPKNNTQEEKFILYVQGTAKYIKNKKNALLHPKQGRLSGGTPCPKVT